MKKNLTMSRAKKGAAILAAAMILGGCGGQEPAETTSAPAAVEETTAEEAETEEVSEEETSEEISEEAAETEGSSEAEEAAADASEETEETEAEASEAAQSSESEEEQTEAAEGQVTPQSIYEAIGQQVDRDAAVRERRRLLHGLGDAAHGVLADHDAVDHDLDGVAELLVELDGVVKRVDLAVDAHAGEALAAQVVEELGKLALAVGNDRGEHEGATALSRLENLIGHLVGGLALDNAAALRAVRCTDTRKEQAEVVVNLGHRAHCGARVFGGRLLVDGYRRRKAVNGIQIGLVHLPQELARIAGERLNVAALALGINGVKREARLARAREAGDDDELVARDRDIDILQVVLARPANADGCICH